MVAHSYVHAFGCSWFSNPVNLGGTEGSSFKRGKTSYPWINQICDGMALPFLICLTLNKFNTPEHCLFFPPPQLSTPLSMTDEGCKIIAANLCTLLNFLQRIFISFSLLRILTYFLAFVTFYLTYIFLDFSKTTLPQFSP